MLLFIVSHAFKLISLTALKGFANVLGLYFFVYFFSIIYLSAELRRLMSLFLGATCKRFEENTKCLFFFPVTAAESSLRTSSQGRSSHRRTLKNK